MAARGARPAVMLQSAKQEPQQDKPRGNPRWVKGLSQNPRGKESRASRLARRDAIVAEWCEPFGGVAAFSPVERSLIHQGAELVMTRPRTAEDRVRLVNALSKIMAQCGLVEKRGMREPAEAAAPTFTDIAAGAQADAAKRRAEELAEDTVRESVPPASPTDQNSGNSGPRIDEGIVIEEIDDDDDLPEAAR